MRPAALAEIMTTSALTLAVALLALLLPLHGSPGVRTAASLTLAATAVAVALLGIRRRSPPASAGATFAVFASGLAVSAALLIVALTIR